MSEYISDQESARRLVKGNATTHRVTLFCSRPLNGSDVENDQLLFDLLTTLNVQFKSVDVSSDSTMHLGLPQNEGTPALPHV